MSSFDSSSSSSSSSTWTRDLEGVVTTIQARSRKQQRLLDRTQAPGDVLRARNLVKSYIAENAIDVGKAKEAMKHLNEECQKSNNNNNNKTNNNQMLIRTTQALGTSFQQAIEESSQVEAKLIERIQQLENEGAKRNVVIINVPSSKSGGGGGGDEEMMMNEADEEYERQTQQQEQPKRQQSLTQELFEGAFKERNAEISILVEGVKEINFIMQDLKAIVVEQGEKIDQIDDNVNTAHDHTVKAAQQLRKAQSHQGDNGKLWMCLGAAVFIIILIIAAIFASR